ncbi:MAG: lactam utilization protein LamB [Gammaproteobacteria bacterium]|jgi:UPF0271 protein|nr:lactam utilization protein LamB [Gammaproteobacteria bacterium]|tara:strand:+ start:8589 stop:9344 length:756 start_codon:yes stop_codon:yes gene_type:complete
MKSIDINADLGEFRNRNQLKNELNILEHISSCSIACGGHIGDFDSIQSIMMPCKDLNISTGPHPSYPDKTGFGRKEININSDKLEKSITEQIELFFKVSKKLSYKPDHVKLHGRLYNDAAKKEHLANLFLKIVSSFDNDLSVIGPTNSLLETLTIKKGLRFIPEAFIDRAYNDDYSLVDRTKEDALLTSLDEKINQTRDIVINEEVTTITGKRIKMKAETLCIHGDNAGTLNTLKEINDMLIQEKIIIKSS